MPIQPLASRFAVGKVPALKEPRLLPGPDGGCWLLWQEQRPNEQGRTTALIRPFGRPDHPSTELTPVPMNLRSRVHDYGGGVLAAEVQGDRLLLVWIESSDRCLWQQRWRLPSQSGESLQTNTSPQPLAAPIRLTKPTDALYADGLLDLQRNRWLGVRELAGVDQLVSVAIDACDQTPQLLYQPRDFAGYACLSPSGEKLAWVEWQQPAMPWDSSELWWASFQPDGGLKEPVRIAGGDGISVFQPQWLPGDALLVAEDSSGWWNLMLRDPIASEWRHPWPMAAETAMPQWIYGMSTSAWDGERVLAAVCADGRWQLQRLGLDGSLTTVEQPFDDLAYVRAMNGRAIAVASNSTSNAGLLELEFRSEALTRFHHGPGGPVPLEPQAISIAEALWFEGCDGERTHAWYYPPIGTEASSAPLLVKSHSGPTAMARRGLNLAIQYWTTRGWGVVDVNYGGSTGFGRAYRARLNGGWGRVDVEDCAAAARALIADGRAHPEQIAIEGGSAGGFTTLACLCFTDVFRVGACRYAVCDLTAMAEDTHRFEARYLDGLVGAWPEQRARYKARSPLQHADRIRCPVLFFQGLQDKVVSPAQTEQMADALKANGVPVQVRLFETEGHGFRDSNVQIQVLEETETFFRQTLGLQA